MPRSFLHVLAPIFLLFFVQYTTLGQGVKISPTSVIVDVDTVNNHTAVHAT